MKYLVDYLNEHEPLAQNPMPAERWGMFLNSLMRLMNVKLNILEACRSSHSEMTLLYFALDRFAERGEHITAAQAAKVLGVSAPSVSRTLKNLEEKGLIERDFDKKDRRSVRIIVTETGECRVNDMINHVFRIMDKVLCDFTEEELSAMSKFHEKLVRSIENAANERGN